MNKGQVMRKGDLVRLNEGKCFTQKEGGNLMYPRINYRHDERGTIEGFRPVTVEEVADWRASDESKGMTDGGDTKLPPTAYTVLLHRKQTFQVLRARCRVRLDYGNARPGMAKILCLETGKWCYVDRKALQVIQ